MRLRATPSEVWFTPDGAAVILGPGAPARLPGLVAPQARAHAWSSGGRSFDVEASVRVPLLGVLMSYRGHFTEAKERKNENRALAPGRRLACSGAFDTIYFHEIRGQLPARLPGLSPELKLHAGRSFIYVAVFGTLPWLAWRGAWAVALSLLLTAEIGITLADFIIEDQVRKPLGGLLPGERATHTDRWRSSTAR